MYPAYVDTSRECFVGALQVGQFILSVRSDFSRPDTRVRRDSGVTEYGCTAARDPLA